MAEQHKYEEVAGALRDQIVTGSLGWGDRLPSQDVLCERFDVSRIVVRRALDILEAEGLIDRVQGGGAFVRRYQPLVRDASKHYKSNPGLPFAEEALAADRVPRYSHQTDVEPASEDIARRLDIPTASEVVHTDYVSYANDDPMMITRSYEPRAITGGTPIENPEWGPFMGAGLVERFSAINLRPTAVIEELTSRMPRPSELEELQVKPGTPVIAMTRYTVCERDGERTILETADILLDSSHYKLRNVTTVAPAE